MVKPVEKPSAPDELTCSGSQTDAYLTDFYFFHYIFLQSNTVAIGFLISAIAERVLFSLITPAIAGAFIFESFSKFSKKSDSKV